MANHSLNNSRSCPVCYSANFSKLRFCINSENPFWRKCNNCKSIYANEIPSASLVDAHYAGYYAGINLDIPDFVRSTLEKRINDLSKYRTELNNVLDIGFGAGVFLQTAQSSGWSCFGTEYSPDSIRIGHENGWTVHKGDLSEGDLVGPFDVVAAIEVLEHVSDPEMIIAVSEQRLREGGALYGTTPNSQSLNVKLLGERWSVLCYPEHQVLLSKKAILILGEKNHLEIRKVWSSGFNPRDFIVQVGRVFTKNKEVHVLNEMSRIDMGYQINEKFHKNWATLILKKAINLILSRLNIGDGLNFVLEKNVK